MSKSEESAIGAMVDEVMEGREAKEAAKAPKGAPVAPDAESEPKIEEQPKAKAKSKVDKSVDAEESSIGFADGAAANGVASSNGADVDVAAIVAERDGFLADSQRLAADFANYRKQAEKRIADTAASQSASLVRDLIPVLDACDAAIVQDPETAAGPIRSQLLTELTKNGLELLAPAEEAVFDPEQHEAVMHEAAPDGFEHDGPVVGEVLRAGYTWKGRVVRPAMVKVIG